MPYEEDKLIKDEIFEEIEKSIKGYVKNRLVTKKVSNQ